MTTRSEKAGILLQWSSELLLDGDVSLAALLSTAAGKLLVKAKSEPAQARKPVPQPAPVPAPQVQVELPRAILQQFTPRKAGKPAAVTVMDLPPVLRQAYDTIAGWPGITSKELSVMLERDQAQVRQIVRVLEVRNLVVHEEGVADGTGGRSPYRWFTKADKVKENVK